MGHIGGTHGDYFTEKNFIKNHIRKQTTQTVTS